MTKRPTLSVTVYLDYERGNRDYEASVEVDFTTDGEEIRITKWKTWDANATHVDTAWFDELVYEATCNVADDVYAEWLADYGDHLHEMARDRAAESFIPARGL